MARPDFSEVTEDQVKELFNEDGPLEDAPADDDKSGDEPEVEAAEKDEDSEPTDPETEGGDDTSKEEEPTKADWDEAPEAYQKEHVAMTERAERAEKAHSKLQSQYTRFAQARKEEERTLPAIRQKAQYADEWNTLLEQHPHIQQMIEREVARLKNPAATLEIPKELAGDPAVQYMQSAFSKILQPLQARLAKAEEAAARVNTWESDRKQSDNERKLNGLLSEAGGWIKSKLGREATQEDMTAVLEYMVENEAYRSGKTVAAEVFGDQYEKQVAAAQSQRAKEKAKKFPARSKAVNSQRAAKSRDALTPEEAISMALADQGFGS